MKFSTTTFATFCVVLWSFLHGVQCGEYGDNCYDHLECVSKDPLDPLVCSNPSTPPTSTSTTPETTTTTTTTTTPPTTTEDTDPSEEPGLPEGSSDENEDSSRWVNNFLEFEFDDQVGVCICPEGMFRHPELQRCVSPPRGECDIIVQPGAPVKTCTKYAQCFPQEDSTGLCFCDSDAIEDSSTAGCVLTHGSTRCNATNDCDFKAFLTCDNGTCVCQFPEVQRWNSIEKKCGNIVGESCVSSPPVINPVCVENAVCRNEVCQCSENYLETPSKECKVAYNKTCSQSSDCHPNFQCLSNVCLCPQGQIYFESTGRCHLPEGTSCNSTSDDVCTLNAECKDETCQCSAGYISATDKTCQALHGSQCSTEVPCHEGSYLSPCDETKGVCECKVNYNYDQTSNRCIGKINEACEADEDCVQHAICHTDKKCTCGGDLVPGPNNYSCFAQYGSQCNSAEHLECYPDRFLKCDDGNSSTCTCAVLEDQTFDEVRGFCVALAGRLCGVSLDGIDCVGNSTCAPDAAASVTRCRCLSGFVANKTSGFCVPGRSSGSMEVLISRMLFALTSLFIICCSLSYY